jgi:cytohesin
MRGLLLIVSSAGGDLARVQQLLQDGVDPNSTDSEAWTSLHIAAGQGHAEVTRLLLSRGADPTARNRSGDTPLHVAVMQNQVGSAEVLLDCAGSSLLRLSNSGGRTPGACARLDARAEMARLLVDHGR